MSKKTSKPNPQWPSKNPGKPSGPKRGNNPPEVPSKPTPSPKKK
jgi:hypothetical protein